MTPLELVRQLDSFAPGFEQAWREDSQLFRVSGESPTFGAVWAAFSQHFRSLVSLPPPESKQLFDFLESCVRGQGELGNTACTCFIENIAQTGWGESARAYMGVETLKYYRNWDA